jgi:hypothetical protein
VHTSFQSTSSCYISTVNALSSCNMSIQRHERGRGDNKRYWGIKMNDARTLYLGSYYRIDCINCLIQNSRIFYCSWKYWYSPVLHGKALAVVGAHGMYLECYEGKLNLEWRIEKPLGFWYFRENLSEQMLAYTPAHRIYTGDQNMRVSTQQSTRSRLASSQQPRTRGRERPTRSPSPEVASTFGRVTKEQFVLLWRRRATPGHAPHSRLCGDLVTNLQDHINSAVTAIKRPHMCHVCGEPAYSKCGLCNVTFYAQLTKYDELLVM